MNKKWLYKTITRIFLFLSFFILIGTQFMSSSNITANSFGNQISSIYNKRLDKSLNQMNNLQKATTSKAAKNIYKNKSDINPSIKNSQDIQVNQSGIITNKSLKNLGVIKKVTMNKLHALSFGTSISELHFIDIYGNQIPWTIDKSLSSLPIMPFGKYSTSYQVYSKNHKQPSFLNNLNQAELEDESYNLIESSLQDNKYSPFINNNIFKDEDNNWWKKYNSNKRLDQIFGKDTENQNTIDANDYKKNHSSVNFLHNVEDKSNNSFHSGGVDLSFILSRPAILDRIEIWMAPIENNDNVLVKNNYQDKIELSKFGSNLGAFGIEELIVETISGKMFHTGVVDKNFLNSHVTGSSILLSNSLPFAVSNELNIKNSDNTPQTEVLNNNRVWDLYSRWSTEKKESKGELFYRPENLASEYRNALFVGGRFDNNKRVWNEMFNQESTIKIFDGNSSKIIPATGVRNVISIWAPDNYISLILKENENNEFLDSMNNIISIPSFNQTNSYANYGWIEAKPGEKLHYFFIKTTYYNQWMNMRRSSFSIDELNRNSNGENDVFLVPDNNVITIAKNININDPKIKSKWNLDNLSNKSIFTYKLNKKTMTTIHWENFNIPKDTAGKYIFNVSYRYKKHNDMNTNLWSKWAIVDLSLQSSLKIDNLSLESKIQIVFSTKNNHFINNLNDKQTINKIFKITHFDDFNYPTSTLSNIIKTEEKSVNTKNDLENLGLVNNLSLSFFIPAKSALSEITVLDEKNNKIKFSISNIDIVNSNGELIKLKSDTNSEISKLFQDNDVSLNSFRDSKIFDKKMLSENKLFLKNERTNFGIFESKVKMNINLQFYSNHKISSLKFNGGSSNINDRTLIYKIKVEKENGKSLIKKYSNWFDAFLNNYTNYNGGAIKKYSDNKISLFNNFSVFSDSTEYYFGKQKNIKWAYYDPTSEIIGRLDELGKIKEGVVSIYGGKTTSVENSGIKNIIIYDENGNKIDYQIDNAYFTSGFDGNLLGDLPNINSDENKKKRLLIKKNVMIMNDNNYQDFFNLYLGNINTNVSSFFPTSKEIPIIQNIYLDPKSQDKKTFEFSLEQRYKEGMKTIDFKRISDMADEDNAYSLLQKFTAVLSSKTKNNEIIGHEISFLKANNVEGKIKFIWKQNNQHKNIFSIYAKITSSNRHGEDDAVLKVDKYKYDLSKWLSDKKLLKEKYPDVKDIITQSLQKDITKRYDFNTMSNLLQSNATNALASYSNHLYVWNKLHWSYNNKKVDYGYYGSIDRSHIKLYDSAYPQVIDEEIVGGLSLDNLKSKKIEFSIYRSNYQFWLYTGYLKTPDSYKTVYLDHNEIGSSGIGVNSLSPFKNVEVILNSKTKDGDIINPSEKYDIPPPRRGPNLPLHFYFKKNSNNKWSIMMHWELPDMTTNEWKQYNVRTYGAFLIKDIKFDDVPVIYFPNMGIISPSYKNSLFDEDLMKNKVFSQIPVMNFHFKFKDDQPHRISKIQIISKDGDSVEDVQEGYNGIGTRRINLWLKNNDGDIFKGSKIHSTQEDGTLFTNKIWNNLEKNNLINLFSGFYGLNKLHWTKQTHGYGQVISMENNQLFNSDSFKIEVSEDNGITWMSDYKLSKNIPLLIRISKLKEKPSSKYAIFGYNSKGNGEINKIKLNLIKQINNQVSNIHQSTENIIFSINIKDSNSNNFSLWNEMINYRKTNSVNSYWDIVEWIKKLKEPQLFTLKNMVNFLNNILLNSKQITEGTEAIGDGSGKFYNQEIQKFINGQLYIYIKYDVDQLKNKSLYFSQPPFFDKKDIRINWQDELGTIDIKDFIEYKDYENVEIKINPGTNFEKVYLNQNPNDIENGDIVQIAISPKNSNFLIQKIDSLGVKEYKNIDSFSITFTATSLKKNKIIKVNLSQLKAQISSNIKILGNEGDITLQNILRLFPKNTRISISSSNSHNIINKFSDFNMEHLSLFNDDILHIDLLSDDGFVFENGLNIIKDIYVYKLINLAPVVRSDKPIFAASSGEVLSDNFKYILYGDNTFYIDASDPLFISLKSKISTSKFNTSIKIYNESSIIEYKTINNMNQLLGLTFSKNDIIKINITPKSGIFKDGTKTFSLEYTVKEVNSHDKNDEKKKLPYFSKLAPNTINISGFNKSGFFEFSKNKEILDLLTKGYAVKMYVYSKVPNDSLNSNEINDYYVQLDSLNKNNELPKTRYNIESFPHKYREYKEFIFNKESSPDDWINANIKNNDKILICIIPNYSDNYAWDSSSFDSSNYITHLYTVKDLPEIIANNLPIMNHNWFGYNGKNELRDKNTNGEFNYKNGLLFPNISDYRENHPDVDIKAYIIRSPSTSVEMSYNNIPASGKKIEYVPIIIQGIKSIGAYSSNSKWGEINLDEKVPNLYNGDTILIVYSSKVLNKKFSNGQSKIINSFVFHTNYVATVKPTFPDPEDPTNIFYGVESKGSIDDKLFMLDDTVNNVIVKWTQKSGANKQAITKTFSSWKLALESINNKLSNEDTLELFITPLKNKWWGLKIDQTDMDKEKLYVKYTVSGLHNTSTTIQKPDPIIYPDNFATGTKGFVNLKLRDLIKNNLLLKYNNMNITIMMDDDTGRNIKYMYLNSESTDSQTFNLLENYKLYLRYTPKSGFIFSDTGYVKSNVYIIKNLARSPFDVDNLNNKKLITWSGFKHRTFYKLYNVDSKLGKLELVYTLPNGSSEIKEYKKVDNNYDDFASDEQQRDWYVRFIPNHENNYWLNFQSNKNNPNKDFIVFPVKLPKHLPKFLRSYDDIEKDLKKLLKNTPDIMTFEGGVSDTKVTIKNDLLDFIKNNNIQLRLSYQKWDDKVNGQDSMSYGDYYTNLTSNTFHILNIYEYTSLKLEIIPMRGYEVQKNPESQRYTEDYYDSLVSWDGNRTVLLDDTEYKISVDKWTNNINITQKEGMLHHAITWNIDGIKKIGFKIDSDKFIDSNLFKKYFDMKLYKEVIDPSKVGNKSYVLKEQNNFGYYLIRDPEISTSYTVVFVFDKNFIVNKNDKFKVKLILKSDIDSQGYFLPHNFLHLNNNNVTSLEFNNISFENMLHKINMGPMEQRIDKLYIDPKNNIPGFAMINFKAMSLNKYYGKYYAQYEILKKGTTNVISIVDPKLMIGLDIGDKISIILHSTDPDYEFSIDDGKSHSKEIVYLDNYEMMPYSFKETIGVPIINYGDFKMLGANHHAQITNLKSFQYDKIETLYSINGSAFTTNEFLGLTNGDKIEIKFISDADTAISYRGMFKNEIVQKFTIFGLETSLNSPSLNKRAFTFKFKNKILISDLKWDQIFGDEESKEHSSITMKIKKWNGISWKYITYKNTNKIPTLIFIKNTLNNMIPLHIGDTINLIIDADDGYVFNNANNASVIIEFKIDTIIKLIKKINIPKKLSWAQGNDINGYNKLSKITFDIDNWEKQNIDYVFYVQKQNGEIIKYGKNEPTGKIPYNLSNGETIKLELKNSKSEQATSILFDLIQNEKSNSIERNFMVLSLHKSIQVLPQSSLNIKFIGFNKHATISPFLSPDFSYQYSLRKKGTSTFGDNTYTKPVNLENGDEIKITIYPNQGNELVDSQSNSIKSYVYKSIFVSGLKDLHSYSLPKNITLVYDKKDDKYTLFNLTPSDKFVTVKINSVIVKSHEIKSSSLNIVPGGSIKVDIEANIVNSVLNEKSETKISKTYKLPNNLKPYMFKLTERNILNELDDGTYILKINTLMKEPVDFKLKIDNLKQMFLNDVDSIPHKATLLLEIFPKGKDSVLILESPQRKIIELSTPLLKRTSEFINLPNTLHFIGYEKHGKVKISDEIKAISEKGLEIKFNIKRANKEWVSNGFPNNLQNGDLVKMIIKGNDKIFLSNNKNNEAHTKYFKVIGLKNKPNNNIFPIILPSASALLSIIILCGWIFLKMKKGR